jgi:hypothetical protein
MKVMPGYPAVQLQLDRDGSDLDGRPVAGVDPTLASNLGNGQG